MQLLELIAGWRRVHTAEGMVLVHPGGLDVGAVEIRQMVAPLRTLRQVIDDILAGGHPHIAARAQVGPAERLVTGEGEYAALATVTSETHDGKPVEHIVAMVLMDDAYALIDGMVAAPEHAPAIRQVVHILVENYYLGLGERRRRPCLYTPPPGWRAAITPFATQYFNPEYPRTPGILRVFDARPAGVTLPDAQDRLLFHDYWHAVEKNPPEPGRTFVTLRGLGGGLVRNTGLDQAGNKAVLFLGLLMDGRFIYPSQLETVEAVVSKQLPAYLHFLDSVYPLPAPARKAQAPSALIYWAD